MTPYDIQVPLVALGIAGLGILYVRWLRARLDRELDAEARERRGRGGRPAE